MQCWFVRPNWQASAHSVAGHAQGIFHPSFSLSVQVPEHVTHSTHTPTQQFRMMRLFLLQVMAREIFNPNFSLFVQVPEHGTTFQPNANSVVQNDEARGTNHLDFFKFVGRIIGKALYDGQLIDAFFTRSFYKHMLGDPLTYEVCAWQESLGILPLNPSDMSLAESRLCLACCSMALCSYDACTVCYYKLAPLAVLASTCSESDHSYQLCHTHAHRSLICIACTDSHHQVLCETLTQQEFDLDFLVLQDIEAVDPEYYKNLIWMLENNITDVLDLTFTEESDYFGKKELVELKPGGKDIRQDAHSSNYTYTCLTQHNTHAVLDYSIL